MVLHRSVGCGDIFFYNAVNRIRYCVPQGKRIMIESLSAWVTVAINSSLIAKSNCSKIRSFCKLAVFLSVLVFSIIK